MSKYIIFILSAFFFLFLSVEDVGAAIPFRDVSIGSPYYQAVESLYTKRIISDDGSGLFRPGDTIERDAFVGLSVSVSCKSCITPTIEDIVTYKVSPFIDLSKTNPFYYCISYASEKNIVQWYPPDTTGTIKCEDGKVWQSNPFCENNKTTRIEAVAMLLRQANLWNDTLNQNISKTRNIPDVSSYWYVYANKGIDAGIITQKQDGTIEPDAPMTRGEFAIIASKMFSYNQCMVTNAENILPSAITIINQKGAPLSQSAFAKDEYFSLIPRIADTNAAIEYSYTWKAVDSITGRIVTGTGMTFPGSELGTGHWYIRLDTRDVSTQKLVSSITTTLIIADSSGSGNNAKNTINNTITPSLLIKSNVISAGIGTSVGFEAISTGEGPLMYSWDFGDGTRLSNTGTSIQNHTYQTPGTYTVTVTMTDKNGKTVQSSMVIESTGEQDTDGDGVNNTIDLCKDVVWAAANNGCPKFQTNNYTNGKDILSGAIRLGVSTNSTSLLGNLSQNTCIVDMTRARGTIIISPKCDQCPCDKKVDFLSPIRPCDVLFPTILSPDKNTLYSRGAFYQIQ